MREEGQSTAWSLADILNEYKDVFEGNLDLHIPLNHRVPLTLMELLRGTNKPSRRGIIKPMEIRLDQQPASSKKTIWQTEVMYRSKTSEWGLSSRVYHMWLHGTGV